ncbi:uracil-DNA glycosylase [Thalassoroseus pseudoceratinae]|uniref:uracil-DNA glycosylase n=1 Tax=Thalassoroseus pseudoceratinae TaxID=2713176 RepID=UPI00197EFCC3|nr:uracil-DNA glycosylase [Thalassoroseus pseudoceratinae]
MASRISNHWLVDQIPSDWRAELEEHLETESFQNLVDFVEGEYEQETIYPPRDAVLSAMTLTPLEKTKVFVVGQDPYHGPNQAHGLAFSVQPEVPLPPSLRNIFKELQSDLGCEPPPNGCLTRWAEQGVLLLNTVLTVRAGQANSHRKKGWEDLTDAMLKAVDRSRQHAVFVLWGNAAKKKSSLIDSRHTIISSAHPSPLSARNGFFGSRPFSQINAALEAHGQEPIDWDSSETH